MATPFLTVLNPSPTGKKTISATAIIREGAERLRRSLNCTAVAEWFNQMKVPVGPYCRRKTWNGAMVRRFYKNLLLSGKASRGTMHTVKIYATGRRVSVKNPKGPKYLEFPHLAHLDPVFQDELIAALKKKNSIYQRPLVNGHDPLCGVPTKRTRFPGQHVRCWYCGRQFVWGGNGITENLSGGAARPGRPSRDPCRRSARGRFPGRRGAGRAWRRCSCPTPTARRCRRSARPARRS